MDDNNFLIQRSVAVHLQIENHLRERIRSGVIKEGDKLPPVPELAAQLGVHVVTVQKALRRLKVAGILYRTPRLGTFVRSSPQNAHIAVFYGPNLSNECTHFYRAVQKELETLLQRKKQKCRVYDDINSANTEAELERLPSFQRYLLDRGNYIFDGIIAVAADVKWINFLRESYNLPFVSGASTEGPAPDVCLDWNDFTRESVAHFASRGKKRLLYLRTMQDGNSDLEGFQSAVREHDFEDARVEQIEMYDENHYQEAAAYDRVCSLARWWPKMNKMPDAILVSDDIAMRGVALALARYQIHVPVEMEVLTCANEGILHHYGIPVAKYEVSPRQFAQTLLDVLSPLVTGIKRADFPCKIKGRIVENSSSEVLLADLCSEVG